MKLRKNKKGFTIVELIIVIAVIGILTAVMVPTIVHLVNKANKASDEALVSNLNKAIQLRRAEPGVKAPVTMHETVVGLEEYGYKLDALVAKSDQDLLYDLKADKFLLEEEAKEENVADYWRIQDNVKEQKYNIYASSKFAFEEDDKIAVGFDAGDTKNIEEIDYEDLETTGVNKFADVVIRTNGAGTTLTVNAPRDVVKHYDYLEELTVTAIADASYHEYGVVRGKAVVSQGHFAIEQGASVSEVDVKNATGAVKVTANEGTLINVDAASAEQSSVIANADEVFVSGIDEEKISGSKAADVELPTLVSSEADLVTALTNAKQFIQLGADFPASASHAFSNNALLDFAGHTITSSLIDAPLFKNNAKVRFVDSKTNGGVTSNNNNIVDNYAELIIDGGKFAGNRALTSDVVNGYVESEEEHSFRRGVVFNEVDATLVINNINLYVKADYGVLNHGQMTINGGEYHSDAESGAYTNASYGYCVTSNNGHMVINKATVTGIHGCISVGGGTAVINDANAETHVGKKASSCYRALYIAGEVGIAGVEINGGYYKSANREALLTGNKNDGGIGALAMTTINGGTFINGKGGEEPSVKVSGGAVGNNYGVGMMTITGGKFSSDVSNATGVKTCVKGSDGLWVVNA